MAKILKCDLCGREGSEKDKVGVSTASSGSSLTTGRIKPNCSWRLSVCSGSEDLEICDLCSKQLAKALESCLADMDRARHSPRN